MSVQTPLPENAAQAPQPAAIPHSANTVPDSELVVRHLAKSYGRRKVVKDVSLTVRKGEVVGLLGPNGAGKTTSFYMIVGLLRADAGRLQHGRARLQFLLNEQPRLGLFTSVANRRSAHALLNALGSGFVRTF